MNTPYDYNRNLEENCTKMKKKCRKKDKRRYNSNKNCKFAA